jgi:hypothetical protein
MYQIWTQFPTHFEYNSKLFEFLYEHVYSCQFINFIFNNEKERSGRSGINIWDYINDCQIEFLNPSYIPSNLGQGGGTGRIGEGGEPGTVTDDGVLFPSADRLVYWPFYFDSLDSTRPSITEPDTIRTSNEYFSGDSKSRSDGMIDMQAVHVFEGNGIDQRTSNLKSSSFQEHSSPPKLASQIFNMNLNQDHGINQEPVQRDRDEHEVQLLPLDQKLNLDKPSVPQQQSQNPTAQFVAYPPVLNVWKDT